MGGGGLLDFFVRYYLRLLNGLLPFGDETNSRPGNSSNLLFLELIQRINYPLPPLVKDVY